MPLRVHVVVRIFMIVQLHTIFVLLAAECCIPDREIRAIVRCVGCSLSILLALLEEGR